MDSSDEGFQMLGCILKTKLPNIKEECSACGIVLYPSQGIILSHGSILAEMCLKNETLFQKIKSGDLIGASDLHGSQFDVLIDRRWTLPLSSVRSSPMTIRPSQVLSLSEVSNQTPFIPVKGKFVGGFRNDEFHSAICRIMPENNWSFMAGDPEDLSQGDQVSQPDLTSENSVSFELLSYFLILKIDPLSSPNQNQFSTWNNKIQRFKIPSCSIGDVAEIVATPFGSQNPPVFFNTYSRGVVSNVNGAHGCWILTDARCIPGSEGGPLFTGKVGEKSRHLTGMITASLCWKNKEWVGFALACSLNSIHTSLSFHAKKKKAGLKLNMIVKENNVEPVMDTDSDTGKGNTVLSSTVLVQVGCTWGSGVIVDKDSGIILTCSHVIKDSSSFPVMIKPYMGSGMHQASVIYHHSQAFSGPYDLAVLKCFGATSHIHRKDLPKIAFPKLGEKAWVVGHALFDKDLNLHPSACAGVVSKVVCVKGQPVMVQSTCAVHAGASGGPLLNGKGDLIGLVVCNTVDKGSNSSYPHINMSVPLLSIWPHVQQYIQTGNASGFSSFEVKNSYIRNLWALDTTGNSVLNETPVSISSKL